MSYRREHRASRSSLFDDYDSLEEGGLKASSSYSHDIDEHANDKAINSLQDRVVFLKRVTYTMRWKVIIVCWTEHCAVYNQGNEMDASRGIMSGTMDRFKMVFEKRSSRKTCGLVACFVVSFILLYYSFRILMYFTYG
ncbi:bet1-like SNARE 1-2 isoform X1 [Apium graveolens]|uniref:bet1-like SNARE 1-2 isoform X1 n=1 Tax=Apium graveolens TaxID=4045 RepID=UPI003D7B83AD